MPDTPEARRFMEQHARDLRDRAERLRTFAEGNRTRARQTLLELARDSDALAQRIEARLRDMAAPPSRDDPSAAEPRSSS